MSSFHRFLIHRATIREAEAGTVSTVSTAVPCRAWMVPPEQRTQLADNVAQEAMAPFRVAVKDTQDVTPEQVFYLTDAGELTGYLLAVRLVRPNSSPRAGHVICYCDREHDTDRWVPA